MKNAVRDMRMRKNLAQGQLAEAMGVSRQTINSIENERYTPSLRWRSLCSPGTLASRSRRCSMTKDRSRGITRSKWFLPSFSFVLGLVILAVAWLGGHRAREYSGSSA